jgi:hypothetical protein
MRRTLLLTAALAPLLAPLLAPRAWAEAASERGGPPPPPTVALSPRIENRPGLGRLTLPPPRRGSYGVTQEGDRLVVTMPPGVRMAEVARPSRNVASMSSSAVATEITVLPGARIRTRQGNGALVIDVLDPPRPARIAPRQPTPRPAVTAKAGATTPQPAGATPAALPLARPLASALLAPPPTASPPGPPAAPASAPVMAVQAETIAPIATTQAEPATAAPATALPPAPPPATAPAAPVPGPAFVRGSAPGPTDIASGAIPIERIAGAAEPTIRLRTDRDVGLAAFRAGTDILVVLDAAIDFQTPEADPEPAFGRMVSRRTQDATVLRLPVAPPGQLRLSRDASGWLLTLGAPRDDLAGIAPRLVGTPPEAMSMRLPASAAMRVVTVVDPQTGGRLLVGTQGVPNEAVLEARTQVQFSLVPTLQGVVVAATSDDIRLRREAGGFALLAGPHAGGSILSGAEQPDASLPDAPPMSQLLDLPNDTTAALLRRLDVQIRAAAAAPSLARSAPRLGAAQAMVALGMGVEAQAVLDIAAADDPALSDTPRFAGLRAAAGILAQRLDAADALADPKLTGTVEIALWRALLQDARGKLSARDARHLAAALPLVMAYPRPLRDRLLPQALEAMALNGQAEAALAALQTLPDDRSLDLMRGMAFEMTHQPALALQAYDRVAGRANRLQRYKALVRGVELRMRRNDLDAKAAADALDRALYGWRGAQEELPLRIRIARLRRQTGQWPEALTMLRDARQAFPDDRAQIDREIAATFTGLFTGDAAQRLAPADFVALYDKNLDLVKEMSWTVPLGLRLADHLGSLDLPGRAEPVMARLVAQSTDPAERALLGARLAMLRATLDDPAGAIDALAETAPPAGSGGDPAVMSARQMLYARAEAARGNTDTALTMLAALNTADADEARADIYAARKDWTGAIAALNDLERRRIAGADTLSDAQQAIVMRLAETATLGADAATLARLADSYGAPMAKGGAAALFRLLTSAPVRGTGDLPRAFEEIQLARQLPGGLAMAAQR